MYLNCRLRVEVYKNTGKNQYDTTAMILQTITDIDVTNDVANLGGLCEITLPLTVRLQNTGQFVNDNPVNLFKQGDKIFVYAWYDEYVDKYGEIKIFEGFIYDFIEGTPLKMRCMDYTYQLMFGSINYSSAKGQEVTLSDVCKNILKDTEITLHKDFIKLTYQNESFANMSPKACLEDIKKNLRLTMFLIDKQLYCSTASNTLNEVNLKTDINVIGADLQRPDGVFTKAQVIGYYTNAKGVKQQLFSGTKTDVNAKPQQKGLKSEDGTVENYELYLFNVVDKHGNITKQKLVDNALDEVMLNHYRGSLTTLLYPHFELFWAVNFTDVRYKSRSGIYTVRGIDYRLNKDGFHREVTLAYLKDITL